MHGYQVTGVRHSLAHPQSALWMDMGLGKTIVALSVIWERMNHLQVYGTLIVAPPRVCQTVWRQEAIKWAHTQGLTFSLVMGTPIQRTRAAMIRADIYLINYEGLVWLVDLLVEKYLRRGLYPPFNMAIFDEVTKLKDAGTKRHDALRILLPYLPYRIGLTGTPASNGYLDLFGQYLALDSGARLGTSSTQYKSYYFYPGYQAYSHTLKYGAKEAIQSMIADITLQMDKADYLVLPPVTYNNIMVELPAKARGLYQELETNMFFQLDSGMEIEVANQAALVNKCLQAANGAVYNVERRWESIHQVKLDALESVVEESGGQPLLVLFNYHHDRIRILERFPWATVLDSSVDPAQVVADWDAGRISMLLGHPGSMGHGLNLQYGGHIIVWFGLPWSLDLYLQANARIAERQGQEVPVIVHRILTADTMDMAVLEALDSKAVTQTELRNAIYNYRNRGQRAA